MQAREPSALARQITAGPDARAFFEALVGEDELGAVTRAHLYLEHELEQFIAAALPHPEKLGDRVSFDQKMKIALACGLRDDLKGL